MSLKRTLSTITIVGALMTVFGTTSVFAAAQGTVVGNSINIRTGANASAGVLGSANQGTELNVLGKNGDWYKVSYKGNNEAYISSQFLSVNKIDAAVKGNNVNVRSMPSTNAAVVTTVNNGDPVTVIGQTGDWYQLAYNNGNAYINRSFVDGQFVELATNINGGAHSSSLSSTYGIVTSNTGINLRNGASTSSESLGVLPPDEVVDVLEGGNEWVKVKTNSGQTGYAAKEFLSIRTGEKPSRGNSSGKGDQVIAYAKQFLGTPYSWGGTDLNRGVDCSGFVYAVMKNFGITLNRSSAGMASNGVSVSKSELVAGDLVLFNTSGSGISHVGIYMGNGDYIHSSSGKVRGVIISNLNEAYSARTYVGARRVLR